MPPRIDPIKPLPPKPIVPKPVIKPKPLVVPQNLTVNANNRRSESILFGNQQKFRLTNLFDAPKRDNSGLIGGTAGSTAAQFGLSEQSMRNLSVIKIKGGAGTPNDFVSRVEADIQKLAPNSTLARRPADSQPFYQQQWDKTYGSDTLAIVKSPENNLQPRVKGNEQGYRLLDQLRNNPNEITINYQANDAFAAPRSLDALGGVTQPGKGSGVDIFYDPNLKAGLPSRNSQGNLVNSTADSAIILGHELSHASHMQRGTQQNVKPISSINELSQVFGTQGKENVFSANGRNFVEGNNQAIGLREEYRNVGFEGHRYGNEPTENSLRKQLGIPEERISYQEQNSYREIGKTEAFVQNNLTRTQTFRDNVADGVKGSRNSALIGAGFGAVTALAQGKDTQGVLTDTAVGAGTGVTQEVIQKVVNGARSTTTGMTSSAFRAAASQVKGAAVAGAIINTGFAVYDNIDNLKNDATRSKAVGTIAGEAVVGAASGAAGAYTGALAGAAIGSIVPGVGTVVGGVVGFAVGAAAGYLADKGLRGLGVDTLISKGVTAAYDGVAKVGGEIADGAKNLIGGAVHSLSSIFG